MDQITQPYSDLLRALQGRRMQQGQIHNGQNQKPAISLRYHYHHIILSSQRSQCWFYWFIHCFQQGESEALLAQFIKKTGLRNPRCLLFHTVISRANLASYTPEATAFICTCAVHALHSVPWLVSPIIQLHPKITEAGLFSPYVLSSYKMFLKTLTRHMH